MIVRLRVFRRDLHLFIVKQHWLRVIFAAGIPLAAQQNPDSLEIRVLEGANAVYALNSRATRGITVQVSDNAGKPVEGAAVSFLLPERGPSGAFATGGRTEIVTTRADGLASVWGMRWNGSEGLMEIRITAARASVRGSAIVQLTLSKGAQPEPKISSGGSHKWLWISLAIAGGAAGGGLAVRGMGSNSPQAVAPPAINAPRIGAPSFAVGKP
jgi:hypothetical protein